MLNYCFFAQQDGFKQILSDPTHDMNLTDLFLISQSNFITDVNVEMPFSTSDPNSVEVYMQSRAFVISNIPAELKEEMPKGDRLDFDKIDHAGRVSELIHTDRSHFFN